MKGIQDSEWQPIRKDSYSQGKSGFFLLQKEAKIKLTSVFFPINPFLSNLFSNIPNIFELLLNQNI